MEKVQLFILGCAVPVALWVLVTIAGEAYFACKRRFVARMLDDAMAKRKREIHG